MDLKNNTLDHWLSLQKIKDFPYNGKINYYNRYIQIKEYLDKNIHPHIELATRRLEPDEEIYLTNHGTDHINAVIQRLSNLVNVKGFKISPYEVYLLLVATQLHDTGHIKSGREQHEKLSNEVISDLGKLIGEDTIEKKMIWNIAEAHGGRKSDGKKDKIDSLLPNDSILNVTVRPQLLAALLRFADELADDFTRTNTALLESKSIDKSSEIFHYYASVLNSVEIDHLAKEIRLKFFLNKEHLQNKYGKLKKEVFLIDEIFARIYKMYIECIYCMRFLSYELRIETIKAKIEFVEKQSLVEFRSPIQLKITERGYPIMVAEDLYQLCPIDLKVGDCKIDGEYLKKSISSSNGN
jgi:hypothetical protein